MNPQAASQPGWVGQRLTTKLFLPPARQTLVDRPVLLDIGAVGYASGRTLIDLGGLTDLDGIPLSIVERIEIDVGDRVLAAARAAGPRGPARGPA